VFVYKWPVPIHADTISDLLNIDIVEEIQPTDWMMFLYITPRLTKMVHKCREMGIKTVGYWLGSDSEAALSEECQKMLPDFDVDLVVHDRNREELESWGRNAITVPFPCRRVPDLAPLPKVKRVGIYVPNVSGKYGFDRMVSVAQHMPDLNFIFYGAPVLRTLPKNCHNAGRLSPEGASELLKTFTCLLRITTHDGYPQNIIEMKMLNRNVICNYPYQDCIHAETNEEIIQHLSKEETHQLDTSGARERYIEMCSPESFKKNVLGALV
jgi:hypothetical protein